MQSKPEKHLYEYAVVRYVPRVERGEYINVGLVMMCKRRRWLRARIALDSTRALALCPDADLASVQAQLGSFAAIADGHSASPIAALDAHERFRWLTAVRSACISTSRPHPGLCADLDATFDRLFAELVE
ncbi:MAG: DUF3037 domain-containing protein [Muribaculaceae bacterium]|nr:DUF3037 domain-containing protein [Muribaculaceae bacterium]